MILGKFLTSLELGFLICKGEDTNSIHLMMWMWAPNKLSVTYLRQYLAYSVLLFLLLLLLMLLLLLLFGRKEGDMETASLMSLLDIK